MFFWLSHFQSFVIFQSLTLRTILCILTSLFISLFSGPAFIRYLSRAQIGQSIRSDGPERHLQKAGTPTMGGVLILFSILISVLLWADWSNRFIWVVAFVLFSYGMIGGVDDYRKVIQKNSRGLSARAKFLLQSGIAFIAALFLFYTATTPPETQLVIPFFKNISPQLGVFFIVLAYFAMVGSSNAVNLTDGLDGLAIFPTLLVALALSVFAYFSGEAFFANHFTIPFIPGAQEAIIFCGAIAGAGLRMLVDRNIFSGDIRFF